MNEIYNRDLVDKGRILNRKKSWRYCLALLFGMFLSISSIAQTIQLGSGTATNANVPLNYNWGYNYSQTIYTAAEMTAAGASATGSITKIRFKPTASVSTALWKDWVVYIGNTTQASFTSTTNWIPLASLTEVFNGTIVATTVANSWMEITFTTPFAWTGGNIVIAVDENTATYGSNPLWASYTLAPTTGNKSIYYRNDSTNPNPATPPTASGTNNVVAQIQFDGTLQSGCSGTPVGGTASLSSSTGNSGSTFTASVSGATSAAGLVYQWQKFISGAWQDIAGATTASAVITAETGSVGTATNYRRKITCTNSSEIAYSSEVTHTLALVYCTPASSASGTFINNFSTTLGSTNISNTSGYTTGGYQNNYGGTAVTSYATGSFNYNFTITGGSLGAAIWIDWNSNGTFETGERVFVTSSYGSGPYAGTISIPGSTALGDYRMRVMVDYNNSAPSDPCVTSSTRTETEDYKITVGAAPSCLAPTALASSNIAATTATLSWTASTSSPSNGYDVYYSTTNTAPLAGTTPSVNNHSASPLNLTGLTSASTYYWWVRSDCGVETSTWAAGGSFTTLCEALIAPTAVQDFQTFNGAAPSPACWSEATGTLALNATLSGTTSGWTLNTSGFANASAANKGFSLNLYGTKNEWMISPSIDLGSTAGIYRLKYRYAVTSYDGTATVSTLGTHKVDVVISTDGGTTWSNANSLKTYTGAASYSNTGAFETINLTAYSGVVKIAFVASTTSTTPDIDFHVDDFSVESLPNCLEPTALTSSNIAATTATLNWTASSSNPSNGYDIYYSTTNTAPLAGTTPTVNNHTASPLNATGLTSASTYYWWVRSDCGGDASTWASGGNFTTTQIAATLPYTQDFSGANNFSFVNGAQINQWVNGSVAGNPGNSIYISNDAGVTNAYTTESTSVTQAYRDIAIPVGATSASFSFDWNANGESTYDYLRVWLVPTSFIPVAGTQITAGTGRIQVGGNFNQQTTWQTYSNATLDLSSFANTTMRLVFEWKNDSSGGTQTPAAVDNISLLIPSCVAPTALASSNIATTTATLSWTDSGSNPTNGYDIYYSTTNTTPLAGTTPTVNNHTASPLNATSLTPASTYYWWVRSDCDSETSAWAYGGSFTTLCVAFTIPYSENFDTTATGSSAVPSAPTCWSYLETAAGAGSGYTYSFGTPNTTPNHFYLTNSSDNSGSYMLVSPNTTDLSDGSNRVRFYAKAGSAGYVLALGTLSDPLDVNSFTSIQAITLTATYAEYTVNLPAGTDSYLAFKHGLGGTYRSVYIDNVMVENMPSCLEPTSLMSSNVTTSSADLSWTSAGSDFDIKYGATGFNVATEGTLVENFTNGGTLSSLTTGTNYQYYVRQDCGNGDLSAWAGPYSFRIPNIGESCSAPIAVTALPYTTTDDTANYSDNPAYEGSPGASGCGSTSSYLNGNDVVYAYTSTFTGAIKIDLTPTATYSGIFAYASCADIGVNCIGGVANDGTTLRTFNLNVQNGTTYYLVISTWPAPQTTAYTLNISKVCPAGVWVGTTSNFNTASNWADNMVPEACTAVTVNVAAPMTISSDVTVASITLGASAVVTVGSTGVLNVGTISVATGGNLTINSDGVVLQSSTAANTAVATVKRNSTPLFRQDYTLWSSPVTGQNLRAFSTQTLFNRFSSYNTATNAYTQEIVTVADMDAKTFTSAKGYLIRMPNDWVELPSSNPAQPYSGSFTGTLNNGTITIPLLNETVDPGTPRKLNLVGNPYPSPISIAAFFAANTNIDQTLYFLRKKGTANLANTASSYAVLNGLGFTSADTDINGVPPTNIQTGQGFLVVANAGTPGNPTTLTFNNTMRTNGTPTFYKGATETNELHRLWLNLSNNSSVIGQTLIGYATGATQGVDSNFDALYFNDSDTALTSIINNSEYIIQGRALPFLTSDIVPLGFKTSAAGSFTITLSNFDGLFTGSQDVFLKDNSNNTVHNLKTAAYTFTSPVGVFNQRFEVQYEGALGTNNPSLTANDILIGVKNQQIKINAGTVTMKKVELIDISGRIIYTLEDVNATTTTIENMVISNQMLVVRITTADNAVVNQKIIF